MNHFRQLAGKLGEALLRFSNNRVVVAPLNKELNSGLSPEVEAAFWARVEKTDSCWLWHGARTTRGGAALHVGKNGLRKGYSANRVSWQIAYGEIADTVRIFPIVCQNNLCVNPSHLYAGSQYECVQFIALTKGKQLPVCGENNGRSKLTRIQVEEIRRRYQSGGIFPVDLAKKYSVSRSTIREILDGVTWKVS